MIYAEKHNEKPFMFTAPTKVYIKMIHIINFSLIVLMLLTKKYRVLHLLVAMNNNKNWKTAEVVQVILETKRKKKNKLIEQRTHKKQTKMEYSLACFCTWASDSTLGIWHGNCHTQSPRWDKVHFSRLHGGKGWFRRHSH